MKSTVGLLLTCWVATIGAAHAMDGVFDRSAEVEKYLPTIKEGARGIVLPLAKDIYVSGISDPQLAAAVNERLLKDYRTISDRDRSDSQYGAWMVKALASFGIAEYAETLKQVKKNVKSMKVTSACSDEIDQIGWHKKKNEIMASRKNFETGDNPRSIQLLNLLQSDDFTYKHMAADRISWEKLFDAKLMDEIAAQIPRYMNQTGNSDRVEWKTIGLYAKLLGYSSQPKYRDVLEQVIHSKAGYTVKKHAQEGLDRLK